MNYSRLTLTLISLIAVPAFAADVGVSLSIGQPGFYGQLDIGNYPRPEVINVRPVIIRHGPVRQVEEPLYLRVPRGHQRNWRRYCSRYDACGRPVYFVKDDWYSRVYAPRYRDEHRDHDERRHDRDDHHDNHDRHDRDDRRDDHDRHDRDDKHDGPGR